MTPHLPSSPGICRAACVCLSLSALALPTWARADVPPLVASGRIIIGNSPGKFDFLSVDPQRHRLLAAHEKDGTADFFDLDANVLLGRVKTGPAVGIAVDPKTGNYFVSVQDDKRVAVVDAATLKETGSIAMDAETDAIIFDAEDRRVFVTNDNGRYVWVIDPDTLKVVAAIAIPGTPECMAHDAASHRVYLNLKSTSQVAAIDTRSNEIVAQWPTAPAAAPHGMAFDARTSLIFSSGDNGKLVAIDARSGRVTGSANIAAKVDQIAFDPDTRRVYCAGTGRMSVVQESGEGLQSLGEVETAATAKNVAVDPKTHAVWSTYTDGVNSYAASWTAR